MAISRAAGDSRCVVGSIECGSQQEPGARSWCFLLRQNSAQWVAGPQLQLSSVLSPVCWLAVYCLLREAESAELPHGSVLNRISGSSCALLGIFRAAGSPLMSGSMLVCSMHHCFPSMRTFCRVSSLQSPECSVSSSLSCLPYVMFTCWQGRADVAVPGAARTSPCVVECIFCPWQDSLGWLYVVDGSPHRDTVAYWCSEQKV